MNMKKSEEKITVALNASTNNVWKVIGAVSGVDKWFPSIIQSCKVEDGQRFCKTSDGKDLIENILEVNHETKTFRFAIPTQDMLPVSNIVEKMKVSDGENGKALVEWSGTWDVLPENENMAKEAFRNLWQLGLKELESYVQSKN